LRVAFLVVPPAQLQAACALLFDLLAP
jgi:hypothetical protein